MVNIKDINLNNEDLAIFMNKLISEGCTMHSVMMLYDNEVFFERYFNPYNKDTLHRMYSETKSLVCIALLFLVQDNKISFQDKLSSYFKEYITPNTSEFLINQTIEESLMMETSVKCPDWFKQEENDRVKLYFSQKAIRPAGLFWRYDSDVSQVLGELVERITGISLLDYLKDKLFNKLGTFKDAYILKVPSNYSWSDSGLVCKLSDMASLAVFIMNKGIINGEQVLDSKLIEYATTRLTCNKDTGYLNYRANGYGLHFFMLQKDGFAMCGMGNQLTLMFPKSKFIFLCNASDEGIKEHREVLINAVYGIVDKIDNIKHIEPSYELRYLPYNINNELINKINNKTYISLNNNIIEEFNIKIINNNEGIFNYIYEDKVHSINFGIGKNIFSKLDLGPYSNTIGKLVEKDYHYDIASSFMCTSNKKIEIDVQVIDKYLGNLFILISFKDDYAWVKVDKHAENFIDGFNFEGLYKLK